jgi:hypothetical protein
MQWCVGLWESIQNIGTADTTRTRRDVGTRSRWFDTGGKFDPDCVNVLGLVTAINVQRPRRSSEGFHAHDVTCLSEPCFGNQPAGCQVEIVTGSAHGGRKNVITNGDR